MGPKKIFIVYFSYICYQYIIIKNYCLIFRPLYAKINAGNNAFFTS